MMLIILTWKFMRQILFYCLAVILLFISLNNKTYAQSNIAVQWLENSMGKSWDLVNKMQLDKQDNLYVVGNYSDTTVIGNKKNLGKKDIFISRYSPKGNTVWQKYIKTPGYCHVSSFLLGKNNRLYLSGYFKDSLKIGKKSLQTSGRTSGFVASMDTSGVTGYIKKINGNLKGHEIYLQEKEDTSLLVAGSFHNTIELKDSLYYTNRAKADIFMMELDSMGKFKSQRIWSGPGKDLINDLFISDKNTYAVVSFEQNIAINNKVFNSTGKSDALLLALDKKGELIFSKQIGSFYADFGRSVKVDSNNLIVFAGNYSGPTQGESKFKQAAGRQDVFVMKMNQTGKELWSDRFGGKGNDYLKDIYFNSDNDLYLSGTFRGTIEKENTVIRSSENSNDIFVAKYENNGLFKYIEKIGDSSADYSRDLIIDRDDFIYVTGNFSKKFSVNTTSTKKSGNEEDFFLTKLYDCEHSSKIKLPEDTAICEKEYEITVKSDSNYVDYYWNGQPGNEKLLIDSSGTYHLKASDRFGCISKDSIHVKISAPPFLELGNNITVKQGEEVIFEPMVKEKVKYSWSNDTTSKNLKVKTQSLTPGIHRYSLTVENEYGCENNDEIDLKVKSSEFKELEVEVYPNPVRDKVNLNIINLNTNENLRIKIATSDGKTYWETNNIVQSTVYNDIINVNSYSSGTYYLIIKNGFEIFKKKIVIMTN